MSTATKMDVVSKYGLPLDVKFCKLCVTSNQRPRIEWNADNICNACRFAHKKHNVIDWNAREKQLVELLDKYRRHDGQYDVIVPGSGGKDGAAVAYFLKHKYNMHPLTVTWAPHIYTPIGWDNFQSFIHSGYDNILGTPNGRVHRILTKLSFEVLGDPFQPFIYGQLAFPFQIAVRYKIPLVFYGENGEAEYGGSTKNEDKPGQPMEDFNAYYFSGLAPEEFVRHGISQADLRYYKMPAYEELKSADVQMHWYSYYHKWIPQENFYTAAEHCGFKPNPDGRSEGSYSKYSSLDDRIDGFHFYLSYIKFGLGRATRDASQEIRSGHLTREEAVRLVHRYDGEFPKKWFKEFLDYANITEERFHAIIDNFRPPHLWEKVGGEWKLKHVVS